MRHCSEASRIHSVLLTLGDASRSDLTYEMDRLSVLITSMMGDLVYLITNFQNGYTSCGYDDLFMLHVKNYKSVLEK